MQQESRSLPILGHRGARFEAPENTLEGFQHALELGLTGLEFDVRQTADGHLVVIHDATVDRTTNGTGRVSEMTLAELQDLDARAAHPDWPAPCRIPTLDEVMAVVRNVPRLQIEIKSDTPANLESTVSMVLELLPDPSVRQGIVLTSFDPTALEIAQRLAPDQPRGLIGDWDDPSMFDTAERLAVDSASIHNTTATPEIVGRARDAGYRTVSWPTNDEEAVRRALTCGYAWACTDAPSTIGPLISRLTA